MQRLPRGWLVLCGMRRIVPPPPSTAQDSGTSCVISFDCTMKILVQVWADGFFKRVSLDALGLIINLGHSGDHCPIPSDTQKVLVVDLSGHHAVQLRFCGCSRGGHLERFQQLLRAGWFPASLLRPKTVFTFNLLDTYHKISLQGKLNLYDFYNAIMQKTDNHGSSKPKVGSSPLVACPVTYPYPTV